MTRTEKLKRARDYVRQGDYTSARHLLRSVNHPEAIALLEAINEIDPADDPFNRPAFLGGFIVTVAVLLVTLTVFVAMFVPESGLVNAALAPEPTPPCAPDAWVGHTFTTLGRLPEINPLDSATAQTQINQIGATRRAIADEPFPDCAAAARESILAMLDALVVLYSVQDDADALIAQQQRVLGQLDSFLAEVDRIAPESRRPFRLPTAS